MRNEMTVPNPFDEWQIGFLPDGAGFPVPLLVQSAISGTVDDGGIVDHAEDLFAVLDERGRDAWNEAAVLLVQYLMSAGTYGSGPDAAERYIEQQPPNLPPSLETMHMAVAAWIRRGRDQAESILKGVEDKRLKNATKYLLCTAVGASGLKHDALMRFIDKVRPEAR